MARSRSVSAKSPFPHEYALVRKELLSVLAASRSAKAADRLTAPVIRHIAASTGGLIRPAMLLLSAKCCGPLHPSAVKLATIVEMIHTATLLHDDVIDSAAFRRGKPSVNSLWGNSSAVVAGDMLIARAFAFAAQLQDSQTSRLLARTAEMMCRGELAQNLLRNNFEITPGAYRYIIENKTASFFSACCELGAMTAGADRGSVKRLAAFGLSFGLAFQHIDDLMDILGSRGLPQKNSGSDIANGKLTLAFIIMLARLTPSHKKKMLSKLRSGRSTASAFLPVLKSTGSLRYVYEIALGHIEDAVNALGPLTRKEAARALTSLARSLMSKIDTSSL